MRIKYVGELGIVKVLGTKIKFGEVIDVIDMEAINLISSGNFIKEIQEEEKIDDEELKEMFIEEEAKIDKLVEKKPIVDKKRKYTRRQK